MEHAEDRHLFEAIVEGMRPQLDAPTVRLDLAANDGRIQAYAALALLNRQYNCGPLQAESVMREYGLSPWHIDSAVLRAARTICSDEETTEAIDRALTDPHLHRTVQWLRTHRSMETAAAQVYYDDLQEYLSEAYVLPPALCRLVVGHYRHGIAAERHSHGEA